MTLHHLTTEQVKKIVEAIGDNSTWPKFIPGEPYCNYVIDCLTDLVLGEEEAEYDAEMYIKEDQASRDAGLD